MDAAKTAQLGEASGHILVFTNTVSCAQRNPTELGKGTIVHESAKLATSTGISLGQASKATRPNDNMSQHSALIHLSYPAMQRRGGCSLDPLGNWDVAFEH